MEFAILSPFFQGGEHKPFTILLERENDTLGFNIIGGRPNQVTHLVNA